jgi:hypothetical protein|tara:strand:+ start:686 stop:1921 length:1236 start_codon:yes stop_codon:yes gene_type:complete
MTSTIKVNNVQNQCGQNIIKENSNTITVGASGDTIIIPSGATITNNGSQTGFGRTGTVNWQTTKITADPGNAVSGVGYFTDTSGGSFNVTLPSSPSAGDIVAVADYANTWDTNNLTVARNSSNIEGDASNFVCNQEGASITFVYVDATKGWITVNSGNSTQAFLETFVSASGGSVSSDGNFKVHTFTGPGTFTVNCISNVPANNTLSYLVVAGGGGAGGDQGGGGGAGGFREFKSDTAGCYTASPRDGNPGGTSVTAAVQSYPITVGGGGAGGPGGPNCAAGRGTPGVNSVFSTVTSTGGGGGGTHPGGGNDGLDGGSGGSGRNGGPGGTGNTPPVSPAQGTDGGSSGNSGGGALTTGPGGGATTGITGSPATYSSGSFPSGIGHGGTGEGDNVAGNAGGAGIVVIRYKFQ